MLGENGDCGASFLGSSNRTVTRKISFRYFIFPLSMYNQKMNEELVHS